MGICRGGTQACDATGRAYGACVGERGPGVESCNGIDDDCDAQVDEDFDLQRDDSNCGVCGNVCSNPANAFGACGAGTCGFVCQSGFGDCNSNGGDGCEISRRLQSPDAFGRVSWRR